jgi:hypothetical protein
LLFSERRVKKAREGGGAPINALCCWRGRFRDHAA